MEGSPICEAFTAAAAAAALAGSVIKGAATRSAAYANANTMDSNAALADAASSDALVRGEEGAGRARMRGGTTMAEQRVGYAAGGVDVKSGSAVDVGESTAAISELDAQILRNNAAREAFGYTTQGKNLRRQASYTRQEGDFALAGSVLGGVTQGLGYSRGLSIGGGGSVPAEQQAGP